MSGETEKNISGWTVDTLRAYTDSMFDEKEKALQAALLAQEKAVAAALASADKAVEKSEVNAERWRASANEWRGAMSDRDRELPSRREVDTAIAALIARLAVLEKASEHQSGQNAGVRLSAAAIAGVIGAIASVLIIVSTVIIIATR